jgi:23S rRNA (cytidine1920-2'-O)/16S rRNA (cytidine1409-2'-O)-methyltransferase
MARIRLLDRICELNPEDDRERLLSLVLCGDVRVDGERVRDPRRSVSRDAVVQIAGRDVQSDGDASAADRLERRYVGRGGLKLEHALATWTLPVEGRVLLDAGSSTGGFTDCLLQHGARIVHAVDVGYNQLDYRLRVDERVIVHERTNIMHVDALDPPPRGAVADLSFRSLRGVASRILRLVGGTWAVLLVKPQFEWQAPPPEFDGTVPDELSDAILEETIDALIGEGIVVAGVEESPIRGRKGNREFLVLVRGGGEAVHADPTS